MELKVLSACIRFNIARFSAVSVGTGAAPCGLGGSGLTRSAPSCRPEPDDEEDEDEEDEEDDDEDEDDSAGGGCGRGLFKSSPLPLNRFAMVPLLDRGSALLRWPARMLLREPGREGSSFFGTTPVAAGGTLLLATGALSAMACDTELCDELALSGVPLLEVLGETVLSTEALELQLPGGVTLATAGTAVPAVECIVAGCAGRSGTVRVGRVLVVSLTLAREGCSGRSC